jgi:RimJ/RimL family protein N-acetyltransferase
MIESEEILLRPIEMGDLEILTKWNFDPEINSFLPARPILNWDKQNVWLKKQLNDKSKNKYIIINKSSNQLVGLISAFNIDNKNLTLEYGITLGEKDYWGKKIAKKASHLFLKHYFGLGFKIIYCRVFTDNERAIMFFKNLGFKTEGVLRDRVINQFNQSVDFLSMSIKSEEINDV